MFNIKMHSGMNNNLENEMPGCTVVALGIAPLVFISVETE